MDFNLTRPCSDCPFLTTCAHGWLGRKRAAEIADAMMVRDETFACHKTVTYDDDGNSVRGCGKHSENHCAGALIFMEIQGMANQLTRIVERLGLYDRRKLDMAAPVFGNREEFVRHHAGRKR
jgi:hypothetical protein